MRSEVSEGGPLEASIRGIERVEEDLRRLLRRLLRSGDAGAERRLREALWHLAVARIRIRELAGGAEGG